MKSLPIVICFTLFTATLFAQADTTHLHPWHGHVERWLTVVTGYDYYGRSGGEIGLGKTVADLRQRHPLWSSVYASSEFFYDKSLFVGPKIGVCAYGGLGLGASLICYTNFNQSSLQFRPEIGFGMFNARFYYGRNIRITNTNFNFISRNLIGVNIFLNLQKLPLTHASTVDAK